MSIKLVVLRAGLEKTRVFFRKIWIFKVSLYKTKKNIKFGLSRF